MEQEANKIIYAGFFTRFVAAMLDGVFLYIPLDILEKLSNEYLYIPLIFIVWWIYGSLMLSSSWGATFGKKILSIKILDEDMQQLSFKKASIRYLYSIVSYVFLLPIFMIFFTDKKQTFHDYFAKTIAIDDIHKFNYQELKIQNDNLSKKKLTYFSSPFQIDFTTKKKSTLRTIIIIIVFIVIAVPIGYMVFYMSIMYKLYSASANSYNESFYIKYNIKDYNDSKIIFYNQELERNTQKFIEAKGIYDIFKADVKKDLALNCIQYFLAREHNVSEWIEMGSGFRKNARNKYANTEDMIQKAKKNADHMGKYFYYYDLNEVNDIADDVANIWKKDANKETCQKMLPVDEMYTMFIMPYIKNTEEALARDKHEYKYAKPSGTPNKSFYKKEIEETSAWLDMLYEKHPDYSKYLQKQNELAQEREKQRAIQRKKEKAENIKLRREREKQNILTMQKNIWQDMKNGKYYSMNEVKMLNFNIKNSKGQTPLMIAVENAKDDIVNSLSMVDTNFWAKDNRGKTAYDYIQKPKTQRDKIFTDRMYGSLRMLEANQIVLGKANIISSSYQNKDDNLEIFIQGADCKAFKFAKNTVCKSN